MRTTPRPAASALRTGSLVIVDGSPKWTGTVAYVTADGFVGVAQGVRVDEVQLSRVTALETARAAA